jgi:hypothetical protein
MALNLAPLDSTLQGVSFALKKLYPTLSVLEKIANKQD